MSEPGADAGTADPMLLAALARWVDRPSAATGGGVHAAFLGARVLVPVVAELLASSEHERSALAAEKETEMSLVTLVGADGRIALPVFTSVAAMGAWRADVRPVVILGAAACATALAEDHAAVVLDVAGAAFVVEGTALRRLAAGEAPAAAAAGGRRWLRPLVLGQLAVVETAVWSAAWAVFRGPDAFYPAMFVGGLLGAAVVARANRTSDPAA
ncbi:MAG: SseB family protein [Actinomycetota bacterium]|nr:SseB family protein [Actinomycetota bacterium]